MHKLIITSLAILLLSAAPLVAQDEEEYEPIDSDSCVDCHEESSHGTIFTADLSHSVHEGFT